MGDNEESEQGKMDKCLELLGKGYNRGQLINDLNFSERTADRAIAKFKKEGGTVVVPPNQHTSERRDIMKIGGREIIPPEAVLDVIHLPADGQDVQVWRSGVLDGVGLLLLGARYSQLTSASQAEMLANQIKIMEEARKGSAEVAQEAAARAAAGVGAQIMPEVQALKNQMLASSPNPMMSMFAQTMQPLLGQVMGNMMGMFQPRQPGQAQQGQAQQGQALTPQPAFQQPAGQEASEDEVKEAFNDE